MSTNLSVVKGAYEAFARGDIPAVLAVIADDVEWRVVGPASLPFPRACRNKEEVGAFFKALAESDDISQFETREYIDAGDHIVTLGFVKSTIRSTGEPLESEWIHVITVKNGLLTRFVEFFDTAAREGH
ncbi:MAG TPA: nuclear transport factor 2 family protein [Paraburkholderia sp.]|uniref:nuclear transport factor 2 family protein n=1 Tax=Paraburkholderia sp. TaxID=1926495 RepID=UPI002ED1E1D1